MKIDREIIAAATDRLDRRHGANLQAPPPRAPRAVLPPDRAARVADYINANRGSDDPAALERAFGTNDLLSLYYFWAGIRVARSVGRIVISGGPGDILGGAATGFMIGPGLLLTNWHVFKKEDDASRARVEFAFEADQNGNERTPTWFSFLPGKFFHANKELDYCVVAVDPDNRQGPETLESFGWLRLNPQLGKADYGQFLSIIQHPGAQIKQVAIRENELLPFDDADDFLSYRSDTFHGSSGSPCFNDLWDVVALHHAGKPVKDAAGHYIGHDNKPITDHEPQEDEIKWIANEGARTSRIVRDFLARAPENPYRHTLEAAFNGQVRPEARALEIDAKPEAAAGLAIVAPAVAAAARSTAVPSENAFTVTLPLNVALRVESLDHASAALKGLAAPPSPPAAPAVVKTQPDEIQFEKLNFDTDYSDRVGYDEDFLGRDRQAPMPTIDPDSFGQVAPTRRRGDKKLLHYHHFSVMVHADRRMPVLSAGNVDYSKGQRSTKDRAAFGKDQWIADDRMEEKYQLPKGFYDRWKKLDYGHLVRRDDNCWGASAAEIEYSNADTFHLTNCTPQHEAFNRDRFGYHGLWGGLENQVSSQATGDKALAKLCIFAGPIFTRKDLKLGDDDLGDVYVPLSFWKVVIAPSARGTIRAFGFIVSQEHDLDDAPPFEEFTPGRFKEHQVRLAKIEGQTIVRFKQELKAVDAMNSHPNPDEMLALESLDNIWFRRR